MRQDLKTQLLHDSITYHKIEQDRLHMIREMDRKIGEFMQKRAEIVNHLVQQSAALEPGDIVKVYDQEGQFLFEGSILQPLFLKKLGIITYRIKREDGNVIINKDFILRKV